MYVFTYLPYHTLEEIEIVKSDRLRTRRMGGIRVPTIYLLTSYLPTLGSKLHKVVRTVS